MADIYTLKVNYQGCENKIWREAQISSNAFLADMGYMVLATFDTLAYHLFSISYKDIAFELPNEDEDVPFEECLFCVKLGELGAKVGDKLTMLYDFGCDQEFEIEIKSIEPMPKGAGRSYPKIIAGEGKGILDDVPAFETLEIINDTDKNGSSVYTYLNKYEDEVIWDYRDYDLKTDNLLLKGEIARIAEGYSAFEAYLDFE